MGAAATVLDLLLPRSCVGCGRAGEAWCAECQPAPGRLRLSLAGHRVVARTAYTGAVRAALLGYKERGRRDLADPLAALLTEALQVLPVPGGAVLVPVPSRPAAVRARGGDHLLPLARAAGRRLGVPVAPALDLDPAVRDSAGLCAAARVVNLQGAVRARRPGDARVAVVVDDIATSGASLRSAFAALAAAHWTVAGAAVIAATPAPGTAVRTTGQAQDRGIP